MRQCQPKPLFGCFNQRLQCTHKHTHLTSCNIIELQTYMNIFPKQYKQVKKNYKLSRFCILTFLLFWFNRVWVVRLWLGFLWETRGTKIAGATWNSEMCSELFWNSAFSRDDHLKVCAVISFENLAPCPLSSLLRWQWETFQMSLDNCRLNTIEILDLLSVH